MWQDLETPSGGVWRVGAISDQLVRTMQWEAESKGYCVVSTWAITRSGARRLPRIVVESILEAEPRIFYVLSADIEARCHTGGCPLCSTGFAWKSDQTTPRMSRTYQNDHRENLDGKGKDECIQRQSRRDRASQREEKSLS